MQTMWRGFTLGGCGWLDNVRGSCGTIVASNSDICCRGDISQLEKCLYKMNGINATSTFLLYLTKRKSTSDYWSRLLDYANDLFTCCVCVCVCVIQVNQQLVSPVWYCAL